MDQYTGKRLDGRYELHELIGVGGMALVYRAYDTIDDRTVAVKILKDEYSRNAEFLRRFRNESKAIAMLSHPNIVKVYDVSIGDQIQYIVEEYIDGISLKEYLDQQKQIKWKEAIHFVVQILRALQHAHSKGIIHRDIKPQNIMLLQDGTIKVTDFGIARFSHNETRTMTDKAIGSVYYIAPEQARGDYTDEKTDIYSVGVMMYEMLTGKLPFEADNAVSVAIMQLQTDPRPPREIDPNIPEGLEEITLKAMQKDPALRYQSAAEMLRDIEEFRRNPSAKFQYKYFIDEKPTKYIDAIDSVKNDQPVYNDNYEYIEEATRVPEKKKKPVAVMIIAGIAAAFLIAIVALGIAALRRNQEAEPKDVTMPSYVGQTYTEAVNSSTADYTFTFHKEEKSSTDYAAGVVIDQTPKAGQTVKSNADVTLTVSTGGEPVKVPDLTDKSQADAEKAVTAVGLVPNVNTVADDNIAAGIVVSSDPAYGTEVAQGTEIKIYVSTGKLDQRVAVPDVSGLTDADAEAKLIAAGFNIGTKAYQDDTGKEKDIVISTDPLNGVKVAKGTKINLVLSSGKITEKSVEVHVDLPTTVKTDLLMKAYIGGVLIESGDNAPHKVNSLVNQTATLTFTGYTGTQNLTITLNDQKYSTYTLNFDTGTPTLTWQNQSFSITSSSGSSSTTSVSG